MRVMVSGSRDWTDRWAVWGALTAVKDLRGPFTLVHGGCPSGADQMAHDWALMNRMLVEVHPAKWGAEGRAAGPLRNQRMVEAGADLLLAFQRNGSWGTRDCIDRARRAGIEVRVKEVSDVQGM